MFWAACSSSPTSTGFEILPVNGGNWTAVSGDALALEVVETFSDNSTQPATADDHVTWTSPATIASLPADSTADSPIPAFGTMPTAVFISNSLRADRATDLDGVVFVLDAGASGGGENIAATVGGTTITATLAISAGPVGDATRGMATYAACATCHGTTAAGSPADPGGSTYTLEGTSYPYPAPGLDAEAGNLGSDPAWNAALLAMAARADVDNGGLVLRTPMPDWLSAKAGGQLLTTQDFADIYAFLQTQH